MFDKQVKDVLIPLADFPQVSTSTPISEAFAILRQKQQAAGRRFRNMLVFDSNGKLAGLLGIRDLLRALMPDYLQPDRHSRYEGAVPDDASLSLVWQSSFEAQCRHMREVEAGKFMSPVLNTVRADAPLTQAAYLMVAHNVDMLPVLEGEQVTGVVRIVDLFNLFAAEIGHE